MAKSHSQNFNFKRTKLSRLPHRWKYKVHDNLFTTRIGEIKPTDWCFINPDDSFRDSIGTYARLAPLQSPIFSRVDLKTRAFVVPILQLQPDFEQFISSPPTDERKMIHTTYFDAFMAFYNIQQFTFSTVNTLEEFIGVAPLLDNFYNFVNLSYNSTWTYTAISYPEYQDYCILLYHAFNSNLPAVQTQLVQMGFSTDHASDIVYWANPIGEEVINLLPFLAYHKIYDDWVRDARLEPDVSTQIFEQIDSASQYPYIDYSVTVTIRDNAGNVLGTVNLLRYLMTERFSNYPKDYFNTVGDGAQLGPQLSIGPQRLEIYGSVNANVYGVDRLTEVGNPTINTYPSAAIDRQKQYNTAYFIDPNTGLPVSSPANVGDVWAEVNQADLITPTKLRYQMALQRFLERANVSSGGSRYNEFVFGEYGIRIPDMYLQRSVLVGSTSTPVIVDEVISHADGSADGISSHVGDFVGRGHIKNTSRGIRGYVKEHCIYMTLQYVVPQQYYWQGQRKDLTRLDNLSFPHPLFQQVGQEQVYNRELYFGKSPAEALGYQYRYAFDQMKLDEIHGEFRSSLAHWRTGRDMSELLGIDSAFLRVRPTDCNRIFAYQDSRNMPFYVFSRHNFFHKMPLSDNVGEGRIG